MTNLRALKNGIVFQFEESIKHGKKDTFNEVSEGGIYIGGSFDATANKARWAVVVAVGDEIIDEAIVPGARVFIDALKWTNGFEFEGETYWKTDEDHILVVDEAA